MTSRCLACLVLLSAAGTACADPTWDRLWQSADQRGQAYLQQGNAAAAARTFSDPRRKAYAEMKAGDYAAAARDLAAFDDRDAHYNRGNALARAGDLKAALAAYDAALAHDPNDADARHNRDLVAQALKQQPPSPKPEGGQDGKQDARQGGKPGEGKSAGQPGPGASQPEPGGGAGAESGKDRGDAGQRPDDAAGPPPASHADRTGHPSPGADAAQARRDVQAGLGPGAASAGARDGDPEAEAHAPAPAQARTGALPASAPRSEQQLAEDQWLRRIPDDPGGLLRRKFMIEHMMRKQQEDKP
jgi:Ca-activated chloride channel family protein